MRKIEKMRERKQTRCRTQRNTDINDLVDVTVFQLTLFLQAFALKNREREKSGDGAKCRK